MVATSLSSDTPMTERQIHIAVMNYIRTQEYLTYIADLVMHIPNEGKRSLVYGALLKKMGMRAGAADLFIAYPQGVYHGAWIEIKTERGRPTPNQIKFLADMSEQGYYTKITYGLEESIKTIEWYCT